jgi:hypothetical protein
MRQCNTGQFSLICSPILQFSAANFLWDSEPAGIIGQSGLIFLFTKLQGDALSLQARGFLGEVRCEARGLNTCWLVQPSLWL